MSNLFARQLEKVTGADGTVDFVRLGELVSAEYEQTERDRRRTNRSISLMVEELDELNRGLEHQVSKRTEELRQREAELRAQNLRFDAALNNMSQALLMFDASGRLVIYNRRYEEMYCLPPGAVRVGLTVRELIELRRAAGFYTGDIEADIATLLASVRSRKTHSRLSDLPDGRTIALISHPMADGGWVVTHEDITERRRAEKQIAHMARHDALTDLPNRVLLRERLAEALGHATLGHAAPGHASPGQRLAVLYLDLDLFKGVNDTLGHQVGDELLKAVAERLRGCVGKDDTVARVGGDEFAVIQVGIARPEDAAALARRICEAIKEPYDLGGHGVLVDTSIGIAIAPDDGTDPNELLKNADMALYGAKSDGRGTFCFFEPDMDSRVKTRRALEIALRRALAAGEFELYYQPLVDLADGSITCCEALIRWHHPDRGMIAPAEFIPLAEEIGLIVTIGEWVLRKACEDAARWPDTIKVAVNLSPIQLVHPNLVSIVVSALSCAGLPAHRLEIEITESMLMQNTETTLATLHSLRQLGVRISMDDFGTGYSSLSYLRSFPFDKIKIDRCFISGLPDGEEAVAIVRAVASLAKNLKMVTTAEGIETSEQLDQVRALGCTEMQGFLFSPPKPNAELSALLPHAQFAMTA